MGGETQQAWAAEMQELLANSAGSAPAEEGGAGTGTGGCDTPSRFCLRWAGSPQGCRAALALVEGQNAVGRSASLRLRDRAVSRRHVDISVGADLQMAVVSAKGCFLQRATQRGAAGRLKKVHCGETVPLQAGDVITLALDTKPLVVADTLAAEQAPCPLQSDGSGGLQGAVPPPALGTPHKRGGTDTPAESPVIFDDCDEVETLVDISALESLGREMAGRQPTQLVFDAPPLVPRTPASAGAAPFLLKTGSSHKARHTRSELESLEPKQKIPRATQGDLFDIELESQLVTYRS